MLSRIADSIYWMSRYLQRAGDTARLMDINTVYLLEAEEDMSENDKWRPLLSITPVSYTHLTLPTNREV